MKPLKLLIVKPYDCPSAHETAVKICLNMLHKSTTTGNYSYNSNITKQNIITRIFHGIHYITRRLTLPCYWLRGGVVWSPPDRAEYTLGIQFSKKPIYKINQFILSTNATAAIFRNCLYASCRYLLISYISYPFLGKWVIWQVKTKICLISCITYFWGNRQNISLCLILFRQPIRN